MTIDAAQFTTPQEWLHMTIDAPPAQMTIDAATPQPDPSD
jgi:hypothetical protein